LRTGDLGRFTVDGELEHLESGDELIISSGYRISPLEVESVLSDHPDVAAALVRGEPNKQRGQDIVAMVLPTNRWLDRSVLTIVLRTHVADVLGP
jgi:acyl-coenzyme A synthetase/AMP-(fatty) acid ligase